MFLIICYNFSATKSSGHNREEKHMYDEKKKVIGYFAFGESVSEAIEVRDAVRARTRLRTGGKELLPYTLRKVR